MSQTYDFEAGEVLLINKPRTWTSFDVVNKLRYALKVKKIGHAGTLDPLADGLLVLCTGKMTKQIDQIQAAEKEYTGHFVLGHTTPSFDLETEPDAEFPLDHLTEEVLRQAAAEMIGEQWQTPPLFSAVRINGKRAYQLARKGVEAEVPAKQITVKEFEITRISLPEVHFRIVCSKGTYIRSMARDFGKKVQSGAYLGSLTRTRIGNYNLSEAMSLEEAVAMAQEYREHAGNS